MYAQSTPHKASQPHLIGAMRQFAKDEQLTEVAAKAGISSAQILRNKLLPDQPHLLSVHELVRLVQVTGNRAVVDGLLQELNCAPSISIGELEHAERVPLTERALEITTHAAQLGAIALDAKLQKRINERMRHEVMRRGQRAMRELSLFMHEVEAKFQAIPVMSVATDALQTMPMPGLF